MAEEYYDDQAGMDFDGEQGPSMRQVLRNGAPHAVLDDDGNAMPSWSAPVNADRWGVSNRWNVGIATDSDIAEIEATDFGDGL